VLVIVAFAVAALMLIPKPIAAAVLELIRLLLE
jgi:hypothetical protein